MFRQVVLKPVLEAPLPCTFCISPLSNTPDSTHHLVSRDCKNWIGCLIIRETYKMCRARGPLGLGQVWEALVYGIKVSREQFRSYYKWHWATKRHNPINLNGELAISGYTSDSDWVGRAPDATKFRILQIYANEERLSEATANRKEDGWAHVIFLLLAVYKHTQWKVGSVSHSFLFVCMYLIHIYIIFSILPPKCVYVVAINLICCQGNQ